MPLEAHIISKCPDTRVRAPACLQTRVLYHVCAQLLIMMIEQDAMRELILPVMQRVYDKVDFKLNYIGT